METDPDDINDIAHMMIGHYGDHCAALMEVRARSCRRHGELASADFWHRVADAVKEIEASVDKGHRPERRTHPIPHKARRS
jgi:hypothetical protein